jgi:GTP-binding protein EngB required for normal cell division
MDKNIAAKQNMRNRKDDEAWDCCRYGDEAIIRNYLLAWPNGQHREEAIWELDRIYNERIRFEHKHADYVRRILSNELTPETVRWDLEQGFVDKSILINECNIPAEVIKRIEAYRPNVGIDVPEFTPAEIPAGFTEVYFWGITNSGKTCALSSILNTAHVNGYLHTGQGRASQYLHILKNLYKDDNIGYLLENTSDRTQYLPFTLRRSNERYARSVSLIELSRDVFKCFRKKNVGEELDVLEGTFNTLNNYLNDDNRKIHFFFIDYEPTDISQDNYTQSDYLTDASNYFERYNVFSQTTDAIYIVITKSDLIEGYRDNKKELYVDKINEYLDAGFRTFDNYLSDLCRRESIGSYGVIPFSTGDVYCQRICKINRRPAEIILNQLFKKIRPQKKSLFDVIKNI